MGGNEQRQETLRSSAQETENGNESKKERHQRFFWQGATGTHHGNPAPPSSLPFHWLDEDGQEDITGGMSNQRDHFPTNPGIVDLSRGGIRWH